MWQMAADGANAVLNVATQLYMAEKAKKEAEEKRKRDLMLTAQQGMMQGAEEGKLSSQQALQQMLGGFTGALL